MLLWLVYGDKLPSPLTESIEEWQKSLLHVVLGLLCMLGVYSLVCTGMGINDFLAPYNNSESNLILGMVAIAGYVILLKIPIM